MRWVNPSVKCWRLARGGLTPAYFAVASGAPVNLIQRMLGHESAAMTLDVYADLFESQLGTVSAAMDAAYRAATAPGGTGLS